MSVAIPARTTSGRHHSTLLELERARREGRAGAPPVGVSLPWGSRDAARLATMLLLAVAGLLASYIGVSGTVLWSRQLLWLGIGIGAVGVGGLGVMGWLLVAFRNVRLRQAAASAALLSRLVLDDSTRSPHTLGGPPAGADDAAVATYVAADGMTHYHRPGCLLLREKTTHPVVPGADLTPCGVCLS